MTSQKKFPLKELKSTLDNLQSCLDCAESNFSEDKDLTNSIKQTQKTVTKVRNQLKSS
jgi:hypothetical protein